MKKLLLVLLVFTLAVVVGLLAQQDPGYVLFSRGLTTLEMSLSLFVVVVLLGFTALYLGVRLLVGTWNVSSQVRHWRHRQQNRSAQSASNAGLIELAQGHWKQAEKKLVKGAAHSDVPLLNYLSAAHAAQKLNAPERRDYYLAQAHQSTAGAEFAVQLTQAELQLTHGQREQALATLVQLQRKSPKHPHVLLLLSRLYRELKSWGDLEMLLPALRKQHVLNDTALAALEKTLHLELLRIAASKTKTDELHAQWHRIPKTLRQDSEILGTFVRSLIQHEQHDEAEGLLRDAIKRQWHNELVYLYGLVQSSRPEKQLATAETWLKGHETHGTLLLTLGRICARQKLWGKARSFFETSLHSTPRVETYEELAHMLEKLEEPDRAASYYREGLKQAAKELQQMELAG
ncbi:MAG: heme biosynthesis HemY N-terminal domain-containing protein [Gammaproteobacteria bacterium]